MIRVSRRPAGARDIADFTRGAGSPASNLAFVSAPLALAAAAAAYFLSGSWSIALVAGGALFAGSAVSNVRFFARARRRRTAGILEAIEVEAESVVDIEALGDHAPALVFFCGDGSALLLVGQWLLRQRRFPALRFTVLRWADDGRPLRIDARHRVRATPSRARLEPDYDFRDIETFAARPETLQEDLRRAFGRPVDPGAPPGDHRPTPTCGDPR